MGNVLQNAVLKLRVSGLANRVHLAAPRPEEAANVGASLPPWDGTVPDGLPVPPLEIMDIVAGTLSVPWFLKGGELAKKSIVNLLSRHGLGIQEFQSTLDFGCGCGRVFRHWDAGTRHRMYGTDYNPYLIEWCRENLARDRFEVNGIEPPLGFPDGHFEFVYALSVFTHMPEDLQLSWMDEMWRVLRSGGYLFITTHGAYYLDQLTEEEKKRFRARHVVVRNSETPGSNLCGAFHPPRYVKRVLGRRFEIVDFVREGAKGNPHQDAFLMRKPVKAK